MKAWDIVGYVYEADTHCCDCARARFGEALNAEGTQDQDGNPIHPIFASNEECAGDVCGDCFAPLMGEL